MNIANTLLDRKSLWIFANASTTALSTCAFIKHDDSQKVTQLISGKMRLTPKKAKQTVSRLETLGILMAIRLAKTIHTATKEKIWQVNILSVSEIALSWLKTSRKLPLCVDSQKCRILKVRDAIEAIGAQVRFLHVPTTLNPADAGTRGVEALNANNLNWVLGPEWLAKDTYTVHIRDMSEIRIHDFAENSDELVFEMSTVSNEQSVTPSIILLLRFSRLTTALRTFARVGKAIHQWMT
ncbi:hypothetical protein ANCDUO_16259 [Ancylostoma duodenale]|uniref:Uncharacterized protein n=1 Tax=Ancylostoma duodenale TaxID=51022 RepID=A0A0C2CBC0_9BILA|nr:hypothetical protein ANCDUO_16259 [Ancylostoma duodenale]